MRRASLIFFLVLGACEVHQNVVHPEYSPQDPTLTALSSGAIGCPPGEIRIGDYQGVVRTMSGQFGSETSTWSATCRGKQFYCTGSRIVQCHEALPAAP